ncbi:MAG: response regulator [Candidatus Marinimicrobia bacterium]|nr:response regulator [Candidatus Neomarinimicrobiota bacterium]
MIGIKNFSIKNKLIVIQLFTAFIVLLFYGIFIIFNDLCVSRNSVISQLTSTAKLIGANSISALNFLDNEAAEEILSSLALEENIVNASIYDSDGNIFAKYAKTGYAEFAFPKTEEDLYKFKSGFVTLSEKILQDGEVIGMVSLRLDMKQFRQRIEQNILIAVIVLTVGMIIALLMSILTQRTISNPVLRLAETVREISKSGDYSVRVKKEGKDEISTLYDGFNDMLEQIHERELERDKAEAAMRESEEKFRMLFESSSDAIMLLDKDGFLDCNKETLKLFGLSRRKDLVGIHPSAMSPPYQPNGKDSATLVKRKIAEAFKKGYGKFEWVHRRKNGEDFPADVWLKSFTFKSLSVLQATVRDITERKRAEKELKKYHEHLEELVKERTNELENKTIELEQANIRLKEADRLKSEFLASMSHELRTPLNAVIGFSEILEDQTFGELNKKQAKYINNILISGRHLLQLINDILDLSKVEAGKMELETSKVNINSLLENSMIMIKEKAMKHGVKLNLNINQKILGLNILADERKLKQIVFNLLSNAVKFTPEGGSITTSAYREGKDLFINVSDTGIGIKPEDQERIFGKFEQVDSSYARQKQGTGLGLALTSQLVKLHGGRIWVESEGEGKGSSFTFVIPIKAEEQKIEVSVEPEKPLPSQQDVDDLLPLILVVEDDRQASELISHYLSEAGYAVANAFDGVQAVEMARKLKPRAITLDIMLPKKDGWDVLSELKSQPETVDIPVVIVSVVESRLFGLNLGAIEYFIKPVNKDKLIEVMQNVINKTGKETKDTTVLIIDDEPETVDLLTDMLQLQGFDVLPAYGGQEGIDLAIKKHPDVIILDLMMPEVSGFDVAQQLRANSEAMEIPILVYTAKDLTEEDRQKLDGNVQSIALKSGSGKEDLLKELEKVIKMKSKK